MVVESGGRGLVGADVASGTGFSFPETHLNHTTKPSTIWKKWYVNSLIFDDAPLLLSMIEEAKNGAAVTQPTHEF